MVIIGFMTGQSTCEADLKRILLKRLHIQGSTLRSQSTAAKAAVASEVEKRVWPLAESGAYAPVISQVMDWKETNYAHELLEENKLIGKLVMRIC